MIEDNATFSTRLTELRKSKGLTQQKLGEALGTHKQAVNNWEKGIAFPSLNVFIKLCQVLEVSSDYLLGLYFTDLVVNKINNTFFEQPCPHCKDLIQVKSGENTCPICSKDFDVKLNIEFT